MRLIDADAFKEYLKNAFEEVKHVYTDGGVFAWRITEDFCRDIDEQPTINVKPERLTNDDFETIRIHLNAQKEKLCNQQRWEEAEEYQRIIDRFMAFASAEPERKNGEWIYTMAPAIASKEGGKMSYTNIGKCRSCGADIVWITMASGKKMPCDAGMISFDIAHPGDKDAQVYVTPEGKVARGYFDPAGDHIGYTSHFATCPNASSHRRKNK